MTLNKKWVLLGFTGIMFASLLTPLWVFSQLQFPFITSKAFYFRICMEAALPIYLYLVIADQQLRPKLKNPLNLAVLIFLAINILTSFTGANVLRSLFGNYERMGGTYYLAHLVLLYFYIQLLGQAGSKYLKYFLQAFVWLATVVAINGLSGKLGGPTFTVDPSLPTRASSTFGNPIFFASYLVIPMFLAAYFAASEEGRGWKIAYAGASVLQLVGLFVSGTRGAVVGLIVGLLVGALVYIIFTPHRRLRLYGLAGLAVFVLLAGGLYANHNKFTPGSTLYRLVNLKDTNTEARLVQWKIALKGYKDHPVLGVGPENYYVIFDKYFDPLMYKYDASWFDKPHNYLIEVLTTSGILGLAAYGAMFALAIYALWRAYKADLISLLEMCLLIAALVTYQAQNFTVFDTVSASVTFYAFMGLAAYLWVESKLSASSETAQVKYQSILATVALATATVLMLIVVYLSNIQSLEAAKRTNFGTAYTSFDPHVGAGYFQLALDLHYNLDFRETVNRYSDFTSVLVNSDELTKDPAFVTQELDKATAAQRAVTEQTGNDPLLWMRLSMDEINEAIVHRTSFDKAQETVNQTLAQAPKRTELIQVQIQLDSNKKDWNNILMLSQKSVELNPYNAQLRWQLAMAYYLNGQVEDAVKAGDQAVSMGFQFSQLQQFAWYIQYYQNKKDYAKVAPLLEQAIALQPGELGLYKDLAGIYAILGNYEKARLLAQQIAQTDPSQKAAMDQFINTLPVH